MKRTTTLLEELRQKHAEVFVHIEWSSAALDGHWLVGVRRQILERDRFVELGRGRSLRHAVRRALAADIDTIVDAYLARESRSAITR